MMGARTRHGEVSREPGDLRRSGGELASSPIRRSSHGRVVTRRHPTRVPLDSLPSLDRGN